jgi:hypothetical protein
VADVPSGPSWAPPPVYELKKNIYIYEEEGCGTNHHIQQIPSYYAASLEITKITLCLK